VDLKILMTTEGHGGTGFDCAGVLVLRRKIVTKTKLSSVKENYGGHIEMASFMVARLSTHLKEVE
jgi:hypothetical protein